MLKQLRGIANLFQNSKLSISRHRLALSTIGTDIDKNIGSKLKVIPFESITALSKIIQGDIKGFAETHIESHICTNLSSLCRDYPYRIKFSIYLDPEFLSVYSECIDVEILFSIIFGDMIRYFEFIEGYRDNTMFKCGVIPNTVLLPKAYNILSSLAGYIGIKIKSRNVKDIIEELLHSKNEITELLMIIPCIDSRIIETIEHMIKEFTSNQFARMFIITSSPSIYDARSCGVSYREFFSSYIEILDMIKNQYNTYYNIYLCNSEVNNFEIIINRATYLASYDLRLSSKSEFIPVKGHSFIDNFILKYLRDCLCSSHIVKIDKKLSQ